MSGRLGPERRGPERSEPDYPPEWDDEQEHRVNECDCGHLARNHELARYGGCRICACENLRQTGNGHTAEERDADNVAAALRRGHGPRCQEPDEDEPGTCVCEQRDLARALAARPSADTETLLADGYAALATRQAQKLRRVRDLADEGDRMYGMVSTKRLRAALDGTQ